MPQRTNYVELAKAKGIEFGRIPSWGESDFDRLGIEKKTLRQEDYQWLVLNDLSFHMTWMGEHSKKDLFDEHFYESRRFKEFTFQRVDMSKKGRRIDIQFKQKHRPHVLTIEMEKSREKGKIRANYSMDDKHLAGIDELTDWWLHLGQRIPHFFDARWLRPRTMRFVEIHRTEIKDFLTKDTSGDFLLHSAGDGKISSYSNLLDFKLDTGYAVWRPHLTAYHFTPLGSGANLYTGWSADVEWFPDGMALKGLRFQSINRHRSTFASDHGIIALYTDGFVPNPGMEPQRSHVIKDISPPLGDYTTRGVRPQVNGLAEELESYRMAQQVLEFEEKKHDPEERLLLRGPHVVNEERRRGRLHLSLEFTPNPQHYAQCGDNQMGEAYIHIVNKIDDFLKRLTRQIQDIS